MSDQSTILSLPYIQPAQAQKHITHNEALRLLDVLVQPVVESHTLATPPATPAEGQRHLVPAGATDAWAGQTGSIAVFSTNAWAFIAPLRGWQVVSLEGDETLIFDGSDWLQTPGSFSTVGIGTGADTTNRLAVSSPATLLTHAGSDHQLKVNKASDTDTASLLFQSNWSGRAEMGCTGSDDFAIKVSADGSLWNDALRFEAATGLASGAAVQTTPDDATVGRLMAVGAFGLGAMAPPVLADIDSATIAPGYYLTNPTDTVGTFPTAQKYGFVLPQRYNDGTQMQIFWNVLDDKIWFRRYRSSTGGWQPWEPFFSRSTILGPVSEDAGVPTGAVIQRGTNAGGEYVRFADGTQICHSTRTLSSSAGALWVFPAPFADTPALAGTPTGTTLTALLCDSTPTASEVTLSLRNAADARVAGTLVVTATGRWF